MLGSQKAEPIKLPGRALIDDGQMICGYVITHVIKSAWVEFVYNKDDCRWRIEISHLQISQIE